MTLSPDISRYQLGTQLRRLRQARSLRLEDVAAKVDIGPSTLSRIETGRAPTRTSYLAVMLDLYGVVDADVRQRLEDLARDGQRPGWLAYYADLFAPGVSRYLDLEVAATRVRSFASQLIPGLLQTSDYAAAVCRVGRPDLTVEQVRALVRLQEHRKELLTDGQHRLHVVLDEAGLRRPVGSPQVMKEQLEHLQAISAHAAVTIQVCSLRRSWPVVTPAFTVLGFEPDITDAVAYGGIAGQVIISRRAADVDAIQSAFAALAAAALSPERTTRLIQELARKAR